MPRRSSPLQFWFEAALAAQAAAVTIAVRSARLQTAWLSGTLRDEPEVRRMIEEKQKAAFDGGVAAMTALVRAGARGSKSLATSAPAIALAAARPGFKKARANARRLTRRKSGKG